MFFLGMLTLKVTFFLPAGGIPFSLADMLEFLLVWKAFSSG
jgi:hypothetical protein